MSAFRRHFEGWQLGVVAVGIALAAAALVVPRRIESDVIPLPQSDHSAVTRQLADDRARAQAAARLGLPYAVRAVGELFRDYGAESAHGHHDVARRLLDELSSSAKRAIAAGHEEELLALRAFQTGVFLEALARLEAHGGSSHELEELAGDFAVRARQNGWMARGRLVLSADERRAAFRIRWALLLGLLERRPFEPTLEDWRMYYRALLRHPELEGATTTPATIARTRLKYVSALEKRDSAYPAQLARGILSLTLEDYPSAVSALEEFLSARPDGRWQLRARNHLATALAGLSRSEPASAP